MMPSLSGEIRSDEWPSLLQDYMEVRTFPGVYVLGSYARRVTFYSQQVRALNLVYGLEITGVLRPGVRAAVVGGGAAGLTAAAALAYRNCEVTLLEERDHLMRLQAKCTHRYLHPHIYDWPNSRIEGDQAQLPLLNWRAGPADQVAKQITGSWNRICHEHKIEVHERARVTKLSRLANGTRYRMEWTSKRGKEEETDVDILIIAVGFGLEPDEPPSTSYWSVDSIDEDIVERNGERWLISGHGDGALTDLIRSCTDRFDLGLFIKQLDATKGIGGLKSDINEVYEKFGFSDDKLSSEFAKLSIPQEFQDKLKEYIRWIGPKVFVTGKRSPLYGRDSSILNRLIVLMLQRERMFKPLTGPCGVVKKVGKLFEVELGELLKVDSFNRVIFRHGTNGLLESLTNRILAVGACKALEDKWESVLPESDETRVPHWELGFFGPIQSTDVPKAEVQAELGVDGGDLGSGSFRGMAAISSATLARGRAFQAAVENFGVRISHFALYKEIRGDGSSTVTYVIEGLTAISKPLTGIHLAYESIAGKIGQPSLDATGTRLGMIWKPDVEAPEYESMEQLRNRLRTVAGTVFFARPLSPGDEPISFSIKSTILNGDALSSWEFDQLYTWEDRKHLDQQTFRFPIEYVSRVVWCPVETLTIQVTLPNDDLSPMSFHTFVCPPKCNINPADVVRGNVLQVHPPSGVKVAPARTVWERQPDKGGLTDGVLFTNPSALTWELVVDHPAVGTAYSLDWKLPDWMADTETQQMAREAEEIRYRLLEYGTLRNRRDAGVFPQAKAIRTLFLSLHRDLSVLQAERGFKEKFDISLMVYNGSSRRLQYVDGACDGKKAPPSFNDFWLPFGLGLSGACLKQGDAFFVFDRNLVDKEAFEPEYYIDLPGSKKHRGMIAVPLLHHDYTPIAGENVEASRMCIGILDVSFEGEPKWLMSLMHKKGEKDFMRLRDICDHFSSQLCRRCGLSQRSSG